MSKKIKHSSDSKSKKNENGKLKKIAKSKTLTSSRKKQPLWFNFILLIIPILFFVVLEVFLKIINYGHDTTQWVEVATGKLMLNPDIAYRYFHSTKGIPQSNQNSFDAIKKNKAIRIFILGGSSAAGYPYSPNGDFGKYIQKKLELMYPERYIEVVNVALTATNSYTMRDLVPGVIEKEPDLILIYAGHNEYYGALGIGSMESIGKSPAIVNVILYLEKYKITVFVRDVIKWVSEIFSASDNGSEQSGTLMSRMARDKTIALNSEIFKEGINQFNNNLDYILETCKDNDIPVVLGTLTCNLKDQKPFSSIPSGNLPLAADVYSNALKSLVYDNPDSAINLFLYAKDLDGLRFRAPKKINEIIFSLGKKFDYPVVDIYSEFNYLSPDSIVGNNLMTDHLHPNLQGYNIIGELFYSAMVEHNLLPKSGKTKMKISEIDSLLYLLRNQSRLDSILARYRILILKNDWPFAEKISVRNMLKLFNLQNFVDSTALEVINNKLSWIQAHKDVADYYLSKKEYKNYITEMNTLISQYPFIKEYYSYVSEQLLNANLFDEALPFLILGFNRYPNAFYSKWIGTISLSQNKTDKAIYYLSKSLEFSNSDPQVLYNLAGAYSMKGLYDEALNTINKCLQINSAYPSAQNLKMQLEQAVKQIN